jgi:hypothetical protein
MARTDAKSPSALGKRPLSVAAQLHVKIVSTVFAAVEHTQHDVGIAL